MEPFTSAAAVLQVIGMAVKSVQETYHLIRDVRNCPKEVQRLAVELQDLCELLATIQRLLTQSKDSHDPVISDMLRNLQTVLNNCIAVFVDIRRLIGPFLTIDGETTRGKLKGLLWAAFREDDALMLQQTLGSYKAMLNLTFAALST